MKKNIIALTLTALFVGNAYCGTGRKTKKQKNNNKNQPTAALVAPKNKNASKKEVPKKLEFDLDQPSSPHQQYLALCQPLTAKQIDKEAERQKLIARISTAKTDTEQQIAHCESLLRYYQAALEKKQKDFRHKNPFGPALRPEEDDIGFAWNNDATQNG